MIRKEFLDKVYDLRRVLWLFGAGVLISLLAGCAEPPATSVNFPTPTESEIITPTSSQDQVTISSTQETIEIGDVRYITMTISVEMTGLAAVDVDRDGDQDLVSGGIPDLTIYLGDGTGKLMRFSQAPGGTEPDEFTLADLNEDGNLDIVVANHNTDHLTILLGDGRGGFQPAPNSPFKIEASPHPHVVQAEDIDSDGHLDLVVDHRDGEGVLIVRGLGKGNFEKPGTLVKVGGDPYRGFAIGDVNGDGKPDLVTPNPGDVGVTLNASSDAIKFIQTTPVAAQAPFAVELADINGDGRLDLIVGSDEGSSLVGLYWGEGNGEFRESDVSPFRLAAGAKNIQSGDLNGDGIDEAIVACYQSEEVLVLFGGRDSIRTGTLPGGEHPWGLAVADFNGDGKDDVVIADDGAQVATVFLSSDS